MPGIHPRGLPAALLLLLLGLTLRVPAQVVISEFLASNATGLRDSDSHYSDWIELQNLGPLPVPLQGWSLTDSRSQPRKWVFPDLTLAAGEIRVIFASGKDRTNAAFPLHTSFKLGAGGEYLGLLRPDGTPASEFRPRYPAQFTDVSFGTAGTGPPGTGYFSPPTPGAPNGIAAAGVALPPVLSHAGGIFTNALELILTPATPGAEIRYTLDGSIPSELSALYTTPIPIGRTLMVRARAFAPGLAPSPVTGAAFTRLAPALESFSSNLPLLVLNSFGRTIPEGTRSPVYLTVLNPEAETGRTRILSPPDFTRRAAAEIRGSSSTQFPKKSYGLELQDEAGLDSPASLVGLPADSDWVLYAPYTDKSLMRDVLAYELSRRMGRYAPRTRFVELFLNRGNTDLDMGDYLGVYVVIEKVKISPHRVAVAELEPDDLTEPEISGGYLLKRDRFDANDQVFTTTRGVELGIEDPKRTQISATHRNWIRDWLNGMERTLYGSAWRNPASGYTRHLDPGSFIDHHWLVESARNIDGYRLSTYWFKDRGGRLQMGPAWDYNLTYGNANYLDGWRTNGWYWSAVGDPGYTWFSRLFQDPDFRQQHADRWWELRAGPFADLAVTELIDGFTSELREAQARNFNRWRILGLYVWPNWYVARTWDDELRWMRTWITHRFAWIDTQFLPPPRSSHDDGLFQAGFPLTLTAQRGTLYVTLDGTDPRMPGGGVSDRARVYDAPILITTNAHLVARSRDRTNWSAPLTRVFYRRIPALAITEIHYQPPQPLGFGATDPYEFLELRNVGSEAESIANARIEGPQGFVFRVPPGTHPLLPGEHILIANSIDAWRDRPGRAFRVTGNLPSALPDQGATLHLFGPLGEPVQTVTYSAEWYPSTAGRGFSLTAANEREPHAIADQPEHWRTSLLSGGTPGRANVVDRGAPTLLVTTGNGSLRFRFNGTPGVGYRLEASPVSSLSWMPVLDVVAGGNPWTEFEVPLPTVASARLFRLVAPRAADP